MFQDQPRLRRTILMGTPLMTGILLLFHSRPNAAELGLPEQHLGHMDVFALLTPVAGRFLVVHLLFAIAIPLLGLSIILLLNGLRGRAARLSRISAFVFVVTYLVYETIIGAVTALLVRRRAGGDQRRDQPHLDRPVSGRWSLGAVPGGDAFLAGGRPAGRACAPPLGLSSMFTFHASPLGSAGILLFFIAVLGFDHATSPAGAYVEYRARPLHRRLWRKT